MPTYDFWVCINSKTRRTPLPELAQKLAGAGYRKLLTLDVGVLSLVII